MKLKIPLGKYLRKYPTILPIATKSIVVVRPVQISFCCEAWGLIYRLKISIVKIVLALFSIEASELMTAPPIAAKIKPLSPAGINSLIKNGKAASGLFWSCSLKRYIAIMPGKTIIKGSMTCIEAAKRTPNWPCFKLLAAMDLWTMYWLKPQ